MITPNKDGNFTVDGAYSTANATSHSGKSEDILRTINGTPTNYRLVKKPDGELVLQGAYFWRNGTNYGHEWHDIPTVDLKE